MVHDTDNGIKSSTTDPCDLRAAWCAGVAILAAALAPALLLLGV